MPPITNIRVMRPLRLAVGLVSVAIVGLLAVGLVEAADAPAAAEPAAPTVATDRAMVTTMAMPASVSTPDPPPAAIVGADDPWWRRVLVPELGLAAAPAERPDLTAVAQSRRETAERIIAAAQQTEADAVAEAIASTMASPGWAALRNCESTSTYDINTGNGFYGAYQFTIGTWDAVAGEVDPAWVGVRPDVAPPLVQDRMAHALRYEVSWGGWHHWPVCGASIS